MSLISGVFNNYIVPAALSRPVVIGAGCIVAIPALELIKRASEDYDVIQRYNIPATHESEYDKSVRLQKKELLKNTLYIRGIGVLILGVCAFNQFPGSGAVGLLGYLTYSRFNWKNELRNTNHCISLVLPGLVLNILSDFKKPIAKAIISGISIAASAVGSFLHKMAVRIGHVVSAILHGIRAAVKVILTPLKWAGSLLKIFKPFVRHPKLGLVLLVGVVFMIGCVKYGHQLTGAAAVVAKAVNVVVGGLFTALAFIGRGIGKTIRPLGTALSFIPTVLVKTVNGIRAVVYFIFHPLQAMGFYKVKASA
jgi:hypothetical protein